LATAAIADVPTQQYLPPSPPAEKANAPQDRGRNARERPPKKAPSFGGGGASHASRGSFLASLVNHKRPPYRRSRLECIFWTTVRHCELAHIAVAHLTVTLVLWEMSLKSTGGWK